MYRRTFRVLSGYIHLLAVGVKKKKKRRLEKNKAVARVQIIYVWEFAIGKIYRIYKLVVMSSGSKATRVLGS